MCVSEPLREDLISTQLLWCPLVCCLWVLYGSGTVSSSRLIQLPSVIGAVGNVTVGLLPQTGSSICHWAAGRLFCWQGHVLYMSTHVRTFTHFHMHPSSLQPPVSLSTLCVSLSLSLISGHYSPCPACVQQQLIYLHG